ncbi:GGDEF domain-containing protein [Terriglobus tenax]|uniref:GGDEF domain-containing protein n=1 Tax=Terriglobus tenax TaxID=1111115 RepID=UPI0021E0F19E|nr:GGDEF domain-containing protein [Terriglobus tenax]
MLNAELIPDLAALAALMVMLEVFRRRNPQPRVRQWLFGMLWIFIECVSRMFYVRNGPFHVLTHVMALDAYVIAGVIFIYSARRTALPWQQIALFYGMNILPLLVLETMYGADYRDNLVPYFACGAFALLMSVVMATLFRYYIVTSPLAYLAVRFLNWLPAIVLLYFHQVRAAVYWLLASLFFAAGMGMRRTLERRSPGRLAIVAGFTLWAFCFVIHPVVDHNSYWAPIASRFWDLQKFIIMVGMLMVLLDEQILKNRNLALHDELTGLPNRRLLEDRLAQATARSERNGTSTAVLLLDLNGFKTVNDTLGHAAGDRVLKQFADSLSQSVRAADTFARFGGDEFVIVVSDLVRGEPIEKLLAAMRRASIGDYEVQGRHFHIEAAVGGALYPDDGATPDQLLRIADSHMYQDKPGRPTGTSPKQFAAPLAG